MSLYSNSEICEGCDNATWHDCSVCGTHSFCHCIEDRENSIDHVKGNCEFKTVLSCRTCGTVVGAVPRIDNGIPSGVHCDKCWESLVRDARKRSW